METILFILYFLFLIFTLIYSGVVVYHILKYRHQLPRQESRKALSYLAVYSIIGGIILVFSLITGITYLFFS